MSLVTEGETEATYMTERRIVYENVCIELDLLNKKAFRHARGEERSTFDGRSEHEHQADEQRRQGCEITMPKPHGVRRLRLAVAFLAQEIAHVC